MLGLRLVLTCIALFVSLAAAWPWEQPGLERRQTAGSNTATITSPRTTAQQTSSGTITAGPVVAATLTSNGNSSTQADSAAASTTDIDPRNPAGGISLISPAVISGSQYYKIGDFVTFQWNYTSLSVTPTAIDVVASCSANAQSYTIAGNQTFDPTGSVLWDTSLFTDIATPLLTQMYTLIIHDAGKESTAFPSPGYLATYNQYKFGMYQKEAYVPLNEFKCVTCSGANAFANGQAIKFMVGMGLVTSITFVWFLNIF